MWSFLIFPDPENTILYTHDPVLRYVRNTVIKRCSYTGARNSQHEMTELKSFPAGRVQN